LEDPGQSNKILYPLAEIVLVVRNRLWVSVVMNSSLADRLFGLLLKPPTVEIKVNTSTGSISKYRLVPAMAKDGFLLSPVVDSEVGFAMLSALSPESIIGAAVHGFSFETNTWARALFADSIRVRISRLRIDAPAERSTPDDLLAQLSQTATLMRMAVSTAGLPGQHAPNIVDVNRLLAHAPAHLDLDVPASATRLNFGFGIREEAWQGTGSTDGVCFRASS
jgi:hypothetical protein